MVIYLGSGKGTGDLFLPYKEWGNMEEAEHWRRQIPNPDKPEPYRVVLGRCPQPPGFIALWLDAGERAKLRRVVSRYQFQPARRIGPRGDATRAPEQGSRLVGRPDHAPARPPLRAGRPTDGGQPPKAQVPERGHDGPVHRTSRGQNRRNAVLL